MGIDVQTMVETTLQKGRTVWAEFDAVEGFEVEIAFVGREEMTKMFDKCTRLEWNHKTHQREPETDRPKLMKLWSERVLKNWRGLKLKDLVKVVPIEGPKKDDNPEAVVEATPENKAALLTHNAEFDNFVLRIAQNSEVFNEHLQSAKKEVANLKQS